MFAAGQNLGAYPEVLIESLITAALVPTRLCTTSIWAMQVKSTPNQTSVNITNSEHQYTVRLVSRSNVEARRKGE